jgi:thymidylate synthase (FAD)
MTSFASGTISAPTVTIISTPKFHPHPRYALPPWPHDAENIIAQGGKGCYDSYGLDGRSVDDHIRQIKVQKHGSVLEHASIGVFIEGVSRGLSHELVRHRAGTAYSQRSTRYTDEDDAAVVLEPYQAALLEKVIAGTATLREQQTIEHLITGCRIGFQHYRVQVEMYLDLNPKQLKGVGLRKWARGKARQVLPNALETRLTMTANCRAWRQILEERGGEGAEPEIRRLANLIYETIRPFAPTVFEDYEDCPIVEGYRDFSRTVFRKV